MLDKQLVYDVLTAAMATGGDMAEIFVENTAKDSINMLNGQVEKANWGIDSGLGLRIIFGTSSVYAYTNNTTRDSLLKLAKDAAQAVKAALKNSAQLKEIVVVNNCEMQKFADIVTIPPEKVGKKAIVDVLRSAAEASYAYDPLVTQTSGSYLHVAQDVLIANTFGIWAKTSASAHVWRCRPWPRKATRSKRVTKHRAQKAALNLWKVKIGPSLAKKPRAQPLPC